MKRHHFLIPAISLATLAVAAGKKPTEEQIRFFESKIRPALADNCYKCHSQEAGKSKGGLLVDTRNALLQGGDSGPAIVPTRPGESLLVKAISYHDPDLEMPPKKQLPSNVVADFEKWIAMGAPDPRTGKAPEAGQKPLDLENAQDHWAYAPIYRPELPGGEGADIDRFIRAKLAEEGISPTPPADPYTLLRRLHFDLNGLPPTPKEIQEFVGYYKTNPDHAIETVVDDLLARPAFGERWGRHWLDVARYAESSGKEANTAFPYAWRYRDYVIGSFNQDKPYHRFLTEQIAGDLLPYQNYEQQAEQIIATGFLALGPKSLNENNVRQFRLDVVDEQIDTLTRAVLGTTVACARCHDHKFDPIPTQDYYAMAGIFLSTDTYFGTFSRPGRARSSDLLHLPDIEGQLVTDPDLPPEEHQRLKTQLAELQTKQREIRLQAFQARQRGEGDDSIRQEILRLQNQVPQLEARLKTVDENGKAYPLAMGVWESGQTIDAPLLVRGELERPSEPVERGFPQFVSLRKTPEITQETSGRLELANWITAVDNPLTARVYANRVWLHLFGQGIVASVDNFGTTGQAPSHPELLDHLAISLIENGWSTKTLIRQIVLTDTYQQASTYDEEKFLKDPENALVWRQAKRRLEAEAIRDAMLSISGQLEAEPPSGSPLAQTANANLQVLVATGRLDALAESKYRSVYLPIIRDNLPDALDVFDFAEASLVTGKREETTVPSQALYLLNNEFVQNSAAELGYRIVREAPDQQGRFALGYLLCLGRPPIETEIKKIKGFYEEFLTKARQTSHPNPELLAYHSYCQALLASAEFRYLD